MTHDLGLPGRRELLRHTVATLAYRAQKVLHDPPTGFADHRVSPASRTPLEIVSHMGDLVEWGERMAQGEYRWAPEASPDWASACDRFFRGLAAIDLAVASASFDKFPPEIIFQGPIADALTHVGQLSLLRGVAGGSVRPESYARAEIQIGRVGTEQSATRKEFDGDASARRKA
jgi:hypothetical protein